MMPPSIRSLALVVPLLLVVACGADPEVPPGQQCTPAAIVLPEPPGDGDVLGWLEAIPDVTWVQEEQSDADGARWFRLGFDQPEDHCDPEGPHFNQMATFMFRDFAAPTVLASTGYGIVMGPIRTEPTVALEANQLLLEHRYFGFSKPDEVDWATLDIEQAAWDHHRATVAMRRFLTGPWVSTGGSKGGATAVFHRYSFPEDVEATLAYVTPVSFGRSDPRYVDYLQGVGDPTCQASLQTLQRNALREKEWITLYMDFAARADGDGYDLLGLDQAFSFAVVELPFAFWQYRGIEDCPLIPGPAAGGTEIFEFMQYVFGDMATWYGDSAVTYYEAYAYQCATQLGAPAVAQDHLLDLLGGSPIVDEPQLYPPYGVDKPWDPTAMEVVAEWVRTEGERLMFVYGEWDPWTAGALEVNEALDSRVYVVPEGNHGAQVADLPAEQAAEAWATLRGWMGLEATPSALKVASEPGVAPREALLPRWPVQRR